MWRKIWRQSKVSAARLMPATANKLHFHCSSQEREKKWGKKEERPSSGESEECSREKGNAHRKPEVNGNGKWECEM